MGQANGDRKSFLDLLENFSLTEQFRKFHTGLEDKAKAETVGFLLALDKGHLQRNHYTSKVGQEGDLEIWRGSFSFPPGQIDYQIYFANPRSLGKRILLCGAQITGNFYDQEALAKKLARGVKGSK